MMDFPNWTPRGFIHAAGAAGLADALPASPAAEPPPETARVRIQDSPITCFARCMAPRRC
jgi:hypothetical protein